MEGQGHPHERLEAWKGAIDLVARIYRFCGTLPQDRRFILTQQMQRAAISVPANVAEGASRETPPDKRRFYTMARGSLLELDTLCVIADQLGFASPGEVRSLRDDISSLGKRINGLISYQRKRGEMK